MFNVFAKIFGTKNDRELKKRQPLIARINELEATMKALDDQSLKDKTPEFRQRLENGESLIAIMPEAFAVVREAAVRTLGKRLFDVQLLGGSILAEGAITEMKTGEGKTLTATLPVYLHGLSGKGAHVVTVNDYLAKRDAEEMGRIYGFLGLTTGVIVHGLSDTQRQAAYNADITYGQNSEFGFDYLRDNMKTDAARLVQRQLNFCIVDEVDSILIDEARTPLIITGPTESRPNDYARANQALPGLQKDSDYILDEKSRIVTLTEDGITKLEKRLRVENLYDPANISLLHHVQQALKAHTIFKKDVDYVVRDGQILIIDENTGRMLPGRRYSDGLHGALEAKEHVKINSETQTLATISYQNYFRMYSTLSGMTGTADTEAVEFKKIYNLNVFVIPTNMPMVRIDEDDVIYRTAREKFNALVEEINESYIKGQPVLVGTASVEKSELLSGLLNRKNIPHNVLNAKNHAREADIIKNAGQKHMVTIATSMAGRGTDIVLGEGIKELGGLYVISSERHDSRRIDNQLRGRSGRQGDPGRSKFYLSLEDDLLRIFASDRLSSIMGRLGMKDGEAIVSPMVSRSIEKAQKRVEEQHFSSRKHLLEYDDVMNQQRQVIYAKRRQALLGEAKLDFFSDFIKALSLSIIEKFSPENTNTPVWALEDMTKELSREFGFAVDLSAFTDENVDMHAVADAVEAQAMARYKQKIQHVPDEIVRKIESYILLQIIDTAWKDHLQGMDTLKDAVSLRGYGNRDPLQEYKKEAFTLFEGMWNRIEEESVLTLLRMPPPQSVNPEQMMGQDHEDDEEDSGLVFSHPDPGQTSGLAGPLASGTGSSLPPSSQRLRPQQTSRGNRRPGNEGEDGLIYQGSRQNEEPSRAAPIQTVKRETEKVGRNDPCPCGSGKKYKKCHGKSGESSIDTQENDPARL